MGNQQIISVLTLVRTLFLLKVLTDAPLQVSLCSPFGSACTADPLNQLLTFALSAPHPPYIGNEPYFSKYYNKRGKLYTPRNLNDSLGNSAYSVDSCDSKYGIFYSRESDVAGMTASYYATIEELDDWVGKILKVLDDEGIRNGTHRD